MVDNTNRLAGTAYATIDGVSYPITDAKYSPGTVTRESLSGMDGVHGYKESPRPGSMSATVRDTGNLSVIAFNQMTNSSVVFELANGKTIVGRNMWTVEAQEVDSGEATFDVKWEGLSVTEN